MTKAPVFGRPTSGEGSIIVPVAEAGVLRGPVRAYVRGVLIGEAGQSDQALAEGESLRLGIDRFPHVDLPCEIRFESGLHADAASALVITEEAVVLGLAGPGHWTDVELGVAHGFIRGTAVNRINGQSRPSLLGRIDNSRLRPVTIEGMIGLEDGGARIDFSMPVEASDISLAGLTYEILTLPTLAPIGRLVLAPVEASGAEARATVERAVADIDHRMTTSLALGQRKVDHAIRRQQLLLEQVTAYLTALIFDRLGDPGFRGEPGGPDEMMKSLLAEAEKRAWEDKKAAFAVVGVSSPFMGSGWSSIVQDDRRLDARWMDMSASVLNPEPNRPVTHVAITVADQSGSAVTVLRAYCDGREAAVRVLPASGAPCTVVITPADGQVRVVALIVESPVQNGRSLALSEAKFIYDD